MSIKTHERYIREPVVARRFIYEYYVTGSGIFPFDMLRYDAAWPRTSEDAARISAGIYGDRADRRSILLRSYHAPTPDRWFSFGWSVGTEKITEDDCHDH